MRQLIVAMVDKNFDAIRSRGAVALMWLESAAFVAIVALMVAAALIVGV
jgi:hypothetical protein